MLQFGYILSKLALFKCIVEKSGRKTPHRWQFLKFIEKITILVSIGLHFERFNGHWKEHSCWDYKYTWKTLIAQLSLFADQVQNTFKRLLI